jgi:tetratricopeptide (TPR) repeat protein
MKDLYAIGNSGHEYIVYFIIPGLSPEHFPIAIYHEERGARIISNSIKSWFPYYFVERINYLLIWNRKELSLPEQEAHDWYEKDLDSIAEHKEELIQICKLFENDEFVGILPIIFEEVSSKDMKQWDYERFLKIASGKSPIAQYMDYKENNLLDENYLAFIKENTNYNAPLVNLLGRLTSNTDAPMDVMLEVFKRRVTVDFDDGIERILFQTAKRCYENMDKNSIYYPFIAEIVEFDDEPYYFAFGGCFFDLGYALEEVGMMDEAMIAYENAIMRNNMEIEEFHIDAFEALKRIATNMNDENYVDYLENYNSYIEGDPWEVEDEE